MKNKYPVLNNFFQQYKPMIFRRKERIAPYDDLKETVFYLKQGYVRFYTISKEGSELTLHIISPNFIFPVLGTNISEFNDYHFETLTPVEVYRGEKRKLEQLMAKDSNANLEIIQQLKFFSESMIKKLEIKVLGNAYHQIVAAILDLAKCFGQKDKNQTTIAYWFTHQDIAALTGLSRERVNLEINNLMKKKLLSYNNHFIVIPKYESLQAELFQK